MRDPLRADYCSFALLAYERDNQRQDEAEGDLGNRQEPQEPGPQEADPEAEADVSFLCWFPGLVPHLGRQEENVASDSRCAFSPDRGGHLT